MLTVAQWHARLKDLQAARQALSDAGSETGPIDAQIQTLIRQQIPPGELHAKVSARRINGIRRAGIRRRMDPGLSGDSQHGLSSDQKHEAGEIFVPEHVYDVCVERINREAPDAPVSAQSEAMIRYAGYLLDSGPDVTDPAGPDPSRSGVSAWSRSGAASVLAPYKARRAV